MEYGIDGKRYCHECGSRPDDDEDRESLLNGLLSETKRLIQAVEEYINYDHSGDPWEEDSREMGEMSLNAWDRDGSLNKLKAMLGECVGT